MQQIVEVDLEKKKKKKDYFKNKLKENIAKPKDL